MQNMLALNQARLLRVGTVVKTPEPQLFSWQKLVFTTVFTTVRHGLLRTDLDNSRPNQDGVDADRLQKTVVAYFPKLKSRVRIPFPAPKRF